MVRKEGLEPPYPFGYQILSLARLPVPPLSLDFSLTDPAMIPPRMTNQIADAFHRLFDSRRAPGAAADTLVVRESAGRRTRSTVPCPQTGRPLEVATVEVTDRAVCPACTQLGPGGYVSFVSDLRLAFACPSCRRLVWIAGA